MKKNKFEKTMVFNGSEYDLHFMMILKVLNWMM